jgi:hypothetical protein
MSNTFCFFLGMACGAGVMYFADPQGGRRRRAVTRDKALSLMHHTADDFDKTARHLRNRAVGAAIEMRSPATAERSLRD